MIKKNIEGYDLVKNVKGCGGYERCGYDKLFVVDKHNDDYLDGLCAVCENTDTNRRRLKEKYGIDKYCISNDDYIIWGGEIATLPVGSKSLPDGGDFIRFYWS